MTDLRVRGDLDAFKQGSAVPPIEMHCTYCGARHFQPCHTPEGFTLGGFHYQRLSAAIKLANKRARLR